MMAKPCEKIALLRLALQIAPNLKKANIWRKTAVRHFQFCVKRHCWNLNDSSNVFLMFYDVMKLGYLLYCVTMPMSHINSISLHLLIISQNYRTGREADFPPFNLTLLAFPIIMWFSELFQSDTPIFWQL